MPTNKNQWSLSKFPGSRSLRSLVISSSRAFMKQFYRRKRYRNSEIQYAKGIYKGNYYRRKKPPLRNEPTLAPLGRAGVTPKPFKPLPAAPAESSSASTAAASSTASSSRAILNAAKASSTSQWLFSRTMAWLKENGPVLVLNLGSICTLVGFTRSDVLELRALSVSGSVSAVFYFVMQEPPLKLAAIFWSSICAAVNAFKIGKILEERKTDVVLHERDEAVFVEHFMPHGVTPKQFQLLLQHGKRVTLKKGQYVVMQGRDHTKVSLVVQGNTLANRLGRRLTAVSRATRNRHKKEGGDAGAWVGEMAYLERYWHERQLQKTKGNLLRTLKEKKEKVLKQLEKGDANANPIPEGDQQPKQPPEDEGLRKLKKALVTVEAQDDCELLEWTYEDLDQLMSISHDMRAAMTRAMIVSMVGKVINFTVAKSESSRDWTTVLEDWKNSGAVVNIIKDAVPDPDTKPSDSHSDSDETDEDHADHLAKTPYQLT